MRIHIVARKMKLTEAIKTFIEERLTKLKDYASDIVWAQVSVSVEKTLHNADVALRVGNQTVNASASTDELYSAIDKVMNRIESQIKKYNSRRNDHHADETEAIYEDESVALLGPGINFTVVKDVPLKAMSRDEAAIEMEKQGFTFWLYQDRDAKQLQLVFKRMDGTYGLLQPVKPGK
ncbi:MAG: ribosome-associated translation inhibitor RaiA [Elusimicrobiales bacterium]|nr:ribosome-associated translation inhibitor RaiA [Elusimicrobiales bacterium]